MDILQHTWAQIGFLLLLQLVYLDIATVTCFAWHNPSQSRSQSSPTEGHTISQRWQHTVPEWYPYNMWKKRKSKATGLLDWVKGSSFTKGRLAYKGRFNGLLSKYQILLDKLSRKKHMNGVMEGDFWKSNGQPPALVEAFSPWLTRPLASSVTSLKEEKYLSRKHKSRSSDETFSSVDDKVSEEKKKVKGSKQSGFGKDGFEKTLSVGFGKDNGFESTDDGFGNEFLSMAPAKVVHEADTAGTTSVVFESDPFSSAGGSWGDASASDTGSVGGAVVSDTGSWGGAAVSDTGSWGGDGFGDVAVSGTGSSWGDAPQSGGFSSVGGGTFSQDSRDCETILTKSCADDSECSCYGFYTCSASHKCAAIQTSDSSSSAMGGSWQEGPANLGFSKRKDPSKVIQIFMLPWKPEK